MHNDIVRLIIMYLDPLSLRPFFDFHNMELNMSFKYDAYKCSHLTVEQFKHIFCQFPNIKIMGVNINELNFISKLKHMNLYRHTSKFDLVGSFIDSYNLQNYCITHLILRSNNKFMLNLKPFAQFIRHIDVRFCNLKVEGINLCIFLKSFKATKYVNVCDITHCLKMRNLELANCDNLDALYKLTKLRILMLNNCVTPNLPANCVNLQELTLKYCNNLVNVDELNNCTNLRDVYIISCPNIQNIDGLSGCVSLCTLHLNTCTNLVSISKLSQNKKLRTLDICFCDNLVDAEDVILNCVTLEEFEMMYCERAKFSKPISCRNLRNFDVHCHGKYKYEFTSECINLENITISSCGEDLKDLANCIALKKLLIFDCRDLTNLFGLPNKFGLKQLELMRCNNLVNFDMLKECVNLTHLELTECCALKDLSLLSDLKNLTHIELIGCDNLNNIDGLDAANGRLHKLKLVGCHKLTSINVLVQCTELAYLVLDDHNGLEIIPDLSKSKLKKIKLRNCNNLRDINELIKCHHLETIELLNCSNLKNVNAIFHCKKLKKIHVCNNLFSVINENANRLPKGCEIKRY